MKNDEESALIERMLRGDEEAFDSFVDAYYPRLYRFAYPRVERDESAAQDVVQCTFEKAIPKLGSFRGEAAFFSWLCSFCRFEIAALYRRRARAVPEVRLTEDSPEIRAILESLATGDADPAEELQRKEIARLVRVTLDALPLRYARVLESKYLQSASVQQIAREMALSEKAAESLLTRARHAFRDGFVSLTGPRGIES